jgi:TusA-related sulfurtransferase
MGFTGLMEKAMPETGKLDLTHAVSFMGLLKCKQALARMAPGSVLEVTLDNPEFSRDLTRIINRSNDQIVKRQQVGSVVKICIVKGENLTNHEEETG